MKASMTLLAFVLGLTAVSVGDLRGQEPVPVLKGPYLGQSPPGLEPEIFAPGIVSTQRNEINSVFTPDGREFYFSVFGGGRGYTIVTMKEGEDGWSAPEVAAFSGDYSEVDMFITHGGEQFFFISKRPIENGGARSSGYQIWVMDRRSGGWDEPRHLGGTINFGPRQLYPTVARDGTLYFNSNARGHGKGDFFQAAYVDGAYADPENLGSAINTQHDETDALIAPDKDWLIFTSVGRPDSYGSGDLYIAFREADGSWSVAQNMGERINTSSSEFCPMLSPDGNFFFFTSGRRGNDDIYWVDARIIETFRAERNR